MSTDLNLLAYVRKLRTGLNGKPKFRGIGYAGGEDMDQSQELSNVEKENIAGAVNESLGMNPDVEDDTSRQQPADVPKPEDDDLPLAAKERLGRQEKRHRKEMRAVQSQLAELQNRLGSTQNSTDAGAYNGSPLVMNPDGDSEDERIRRAVTFALNHKDEMERKQQAERDMAHVQRQYQKFSDHLDNASDKYADFDEIVRGDDVPFTPAIRDAAALFIDNPADVLYTLGKDKEKLKQISQLHPQEQMRTVIKLSHALLTGAGNSKAQPSQSVNPLGQVKGAGVSRSGAITENTPVNELRERMRSGGMWGRTKRIT